MKALFDQIDKDKNGKIGAEAIGTNVFEKLGIPQTKDEVNAILKKNNLSTEPPTSKLDYDMFKNVIGAAAKAGDGAAATGT